jgi:hypothetical protein
LKRVEKSYVAGHNRSTTSTLTLLTVDTSMDIYYSGTRNHNLTREEFARTNLTIGMGVNINGEGTSHDGGDGVDGNCTERYVTT